ncbi:helix-turn-helix domain-containing protein [Haloprofundus salilacus]|uniref:helix-turn-helix domain-containing protein n=1 Tax=Haloprofundus salilacus TaxID=2876190 RepID=UPI001CD02025|nr:helix-turn-helix domain-containing protein [Haloprofundus salilacus]
MMKPTREAGQDRQFGYYSGGSLENVITDAVSHPRRRRVLAHLLEQRRPVLLEDLAAEVAEMEYDSPTEEETEEVLTSLYHFHIPKLAAANIVEHEGEGKWSSVEIVGDAMPLRVSLEATLDEKITEYYTT